eukprot:1993791-Pyramimonas_sp.AAC.1
MPGKGWMGSNGFLFGGSGLFQNYEGRGAHDLSLLPWQQRALQGAAPSWGAPPNWLIASLYRSNLPQLSRAFSTTDYGQAHGRACTKAHRDKVCAGT